MPLPATIDLFGEARTVQVNHCKTPGCNNFGVPARHEPQRPGSSAERDFAYKVDSGAGAAPSVRCKSCHDNPSMKSNQAIAEEVARLVESGGMMLPEEAASCPNPDCGNHGGSVASLGRAGYRKRGATADRRGRLYECKECGRRFTSSNPVRLHDRNRRYAVDLFGRIDNKAPGRGAIRGARLKSNNSYYSILRFIQSRCRAFSGGIDRALADGRLRLLGSLVLQSDAQEYTLNWTSRLDRRNVVLSCYCTVESRSGFILGAHVNFNERADAFETNRDAIRHGDITTPAQ